MSTIETHHDGYLGSESIAGSYAAERTPLLNPNSRSGSNRPKSRSSSAHEYPIEELQDSQEEMLTLPLLLEQFWILLKSSIPVFGTHLLEYALLITSVLTVGHLGTLELAACTLGTMTANVTAFSVVIGMGGALDTVLPGVWGASSNDNSNFDSHKPEPGRKIADSRLLGLWCQRMAVLYLLLLVPMLCIWLNAEDILILLRQDREVARLASRYLARLALGLPAFALITITKRYFQAQGLFSLPTKISTVVAGINVLMTVTLVHYPHPLPRSLEPYLHLGFDGAPLSTSISYNLVALSSVICGWKIEVARRKRREEHEARIEQTMSSSNSISYLDTSTSQCNGISSSITAVSSRSTSRDPSPASRLDPDQQSFIETSEELRSAWYPLSMRALHPTGLATLLHLGLGGVGQIASEWWAWELVGLAASLLGPKALAAQSVLLVSTTTTYQAPFSLGVAASVRIGQLLGLAQPRPAKLAAHAAFLLGLAISLVFSAIFWVWRNQWAYLFNDDEDVAVMVGSVLPLVALFQVFDGTVGIVGGILRARGKQATGALLNLSAYYVVGIPLGIYLAFKDIGFPDSTPDQSVVHSLGNRLTTMLSPSSPSSALPSLHFQPILSGSIVASQSMATMVDDPIYPSLPEATAGLRGLWIGLTVALVYCSLVGTILCFMTNWEREVEKVRARVRAEERRGHPDGNQSEDDSDGATFVES
ncbi:mate-domain-containing protein [Gymnopus androsaceus JB14]|uniref:Mate-domain-containing protein n=1 Tax=Gymnopus androsaceus JB14 TaxID=1447944 RepID=A0A6A4HFV1_9AGAR|nr:mate-domain-containing protein [Gymnopus androsaceus JB14]